jgi:hypothetical protein
MARKTALLLPLLLASLPGCESAEPTPPPEAGVDAAPDAVPSDALPPETVVAPDAIVDQAVSDATVAPDAPSGPPPSKLPFSYTRPDVGQPVTAAELTAITSKYLKLLDDLRYFDFLEERVHGWPQTDPAGKFWYGTWWSGVSVIKQGSQVTYLHASDGADNNGLRTAQLMEGACYAHLLWGQPTTGLVAHRIVRGFSSWVMAFEYPGGPTKTLLSRAAYPVSVVSTEGGRNLYVDYSQNRPGLDNSATVYVHIPQNTHWGDLWVKNKRSKDDLGHMFRAMAQVEACTGRVSTDADQSLTQMRQLYAAWSKAVEADGWKIATLDKNLALYIPLETLARFIPIGNSECCGLLMLRLMGQGNPGTLSCGNGISLEEVLGGELIKSGNKQMLRTYHEAAANHALLTGHNTVALDLLKGLATRIESNLTAVEAGNPPSNLNLIDLPPLMMHAANAGVPLTSREVRWLHKRIEEADTHYRSPGMQPTFDVFDPSTPDGTYPYEPWSAGIHITELGLALGSCASQYRNPAARPLLDCAMVETWH